MPRLARVEMVASYEVAIVHVLNRKVRRCFLLGNDPVSRKNFDHRQTFGGWHQIVPAQPSGLLTQDRI